MRRLTAFLLCLLFASVSFGLTLSDARTEIRRNVKDTGQASARQRYSDTILTAFINEAQRDIVNKTWCIRDTASITLVGSTTYYDLESDVIALTDVWFVDSSNDIDVLEERFERSLRQENPDFGDETGDPIEYFVRQSTSGVNALEMGIRPIPSSAAGTIKYHYFAQAADLSSDSDVPFEGLSHLYPYHDLLVYFVSAKILLIEGIVDRSGSFYQVYALGLQAMKARLGEAPNYNASLRIGR